MSAHLAGQTDTASAFDLHIDEAGIEIRFESMCRARGFAYASERLEAVRQRVHRLLQDAGHMSGEWIG